MLHLEDPSVRKQFDEALASFIERAKQDTKVLALIVYGSMAYDEVIKQSNINMYVVTTEGKHRSTRLIEHGIPIDVEIYNRNEFMRLTQSARGRGLLQSLSYSKLLFSRDESLTLYYNGLDGTVGTRDKAILQIMYHNAVLYDFAKSEKYLYIKNDIPHSFHFLIHGLSELGYLLCYLNDVYPPREVIVRGREFESELYPELYDGLINNEVTKESLERTLNKVYEFMDSLDLIVYKPILDFISENDGTISQTDLTLYVQERGLRFIEIENLHRRRIVRRTVSPVRFMRRGVVEYQEAQYHFDWKSFDPDKVISTKVGPSNVDQSLVKADYQEALDSLVKRAESDEYILSFILGGSLAYDTVWEKSDIDIILVTRDELAGSFHGLIENDVFFDTIAAPRDEFRKSVLRATDGSIWHSYFSKSTLIFTKDESIHDLYEDIENLGSRDLENLILLNLVFCRDLINKAKKALHVKEDPAFCLNFIMSGVRRLANIEVLVNRTIPLRESIAQALEFNPDLFHKIFTNLITNPTKDASTLEDVLWIMDSYLREKLELIAQPLLRLLAKEGEMTHYDLKTQFSEIWLPLNLSDFVEQGLILQTESPLRLTRKSTAEMTQPAYQLAHGSRDQVQDFDEEDLPFGVF